MDFAWFDLGDGRSVFRRIDASPAPKRSSLPTPRIISDTMDPTEHVDGRFYESKAQYRAVTKANGCIEIGNDPARFRQPAKPKPDRQAKRDVIQRAEYMVRNGIKP